MDDLKVCEKFSRNDDIWREIAPMGLQRNGCAAVCVEKWRSIFVFGGNNHFVGSVDRIERYEIDNDKWVMLNIRLLEPALDISCYHLTNGKILIIGGHTASGMRTNLEVIDLNNELEC